MKNFEQELYNQYKNSKIHSKVVPWVPANKGNVDEWMDVIYADVTKRLLPHIEKNEDETFVHYWPAYFIVGQTNNVWAVIQGKTVYELQGFFGTGYIAVTNQNLYLCAKASLTKKFPLIERGGLLLGFLGTLEGLAGQKDEREALKDDKDWILPSNVINSEKIYQNSEKISPKEPYINLNTTYGEWQIHNYFKNTLEEIQVGIMMTRTRKYKQIQDMANGISDQKYTINMSGDFRGAILNINSILEAVSQNINASSAESNAKDELIQLFEKLKSELQQISVDKIEQAETVADSAKTLVESATKARPNKTTIQINAEGLKKAAENISSVMPTVLTIVTKIIQTVFQIAGIA